MASYNADLMQYPLTYLSTDEFPLRWRFFEDAQKYTVLSEEDRIAFKPLSEESSRSLWDGWVRGILETFDQPAPTIYERSEDGWEQELRDLLCSRVTVPDTESLYFFWEPTIAVEAKWGVFLKYWDDFCYPSDAGNVAIIPKRPEAIIYRGEKFWIFPRKDKPYTQGEIECLGENTWPWRGPYCGKCRNHIPQFAVISPEDERHLKSLPAMQAFKEIRARTGCPSLWAKIWAFHPQGPHPSPPPCPYCARPLRTAEAQQCFECGADWHGERSREE